MSHSRIATARTYVATAHPYVTTVCLVGALLGLFATSSFARSTCRTEGSFATWKKEFRREVVAAGIKPGTIRRTYDTVSFQPGIIKRDRRQCFFSLTFAEFSKRLVTSHRLKAGARKLNNVLPSSVARKRNTACRAQSSPRSGRWRAISAQAPLSRPKSSIHWRRWPTIAAGPNCFAAS